MANISSAGIGSGIDVEKIVTQLMALEKRPLNSLQAKASTLTTKISAFAQIKSQLTSLSDAAAKLTSASTWNAKTATSSLSDAVAVTASGAAAATAFSVQVQQLATAQLAASAKVDSTTRFGGGTLEFSIGSRLDPGAPRQQVSLTVDAGASLSEVAAQINRSDAGVSATLVNDGAGQQQLLLRSKATGEVHGFELQVTDNGTPAPGQSGLSALLPPGGLAITDAKNAQATVNGIAITSASNTLADTVPGVSLQLLKKTEPGAAAEITVKDDAPSLQTAVEAFVTAYNAANALLASNTRYNAATKSGALLQGDSTAVGLQNALRGILGSTNGASGVFKSLSDIGVGFGKSADGSLALDADKLKKALDGNMDGVRALFDASQPTSVGARLKSFLGAVTGSDGALGSKTASLELQQRANNKDQDRINDRLGAIEARIRRQYEALDVVMANSNALSSYMSQQIAQWNRTNG